MRRSNAPQPGRGCPPRPIGWRPGRRAGPMGLAALVLPILLGSLLAARPASADEPRPAPGQGPTPSPASEAETPVVSPDPADEDEPAPAPPRRVGPTVRSTHEAAKQSRRLSGDDPYDDPADWRDVPAWQQASFYGIRAKGSFFVFVVDCSGSMDVDLRLERAKAELRRCISGMRYPQRFLIIFFNHRSIPMAGGLPRSADTPGKRATFSWLNTIEADGGTDPRSAMNLALGLRPDAIFLLTDGEFRPGTETTILKRNSDGIPIHCIDLGSGLGAEQLRTIAEGSGGRYALRR